MRISRRRRLPPVIRCDIEFNGFVTANPNYFIQEFNANRYRDSTNPTWEVIQKIYLCSDDVSVQYVYYEVREPPCDVQFRDFLQAQNNRFKTVAEADLYNQQFTPRLPILQMTYVCTVNPGTNYTYYEVRLNICDVQFSAFLQANPNVFGTTAEADAYNSQFTPPRFIDTKIYTCTVAPNTPYRYYEVVAPTLCDTIYQQRLNDYNSSNRRTRIARYLRQQFRTPAEATTYIDSLPPYVDVNGDFSFAVNRVFQPREISQITIAFGSAPNCPTFEFYVSGERADINDDPQIPFDP